jgi:hypothetical protein
MTNPRLPEPVEKTDQGYAQVQDRIVKMRRAGTLPYGWITDATRRGYLTDTFSDAGDFLRRVKGLYRADLWQPSDFYCEVWTESRSIAGVIQDDCEDLAVSLYPCGGFASISLAYQAAEYINSRRDGKHVVILFIGDYDPAGVLIDVALEQELRKHLRPDVDMTFARLAITHQQIRKHDLPSKPRKPTDRRVPELLETVEAEAMPAHLLRGMLRKEIDLLLPPNALAVAKAAEESERSRLNLITSLIDGGTL